MPFYFLIQGRCSSVHTTKGLHQGAGTAEESIDF